LTFPNCRISVYLSQNPNNTWIAHGDASSFVQTLLEKDFTFSHVQPEGKIKGMTAAYSMTSGNVLSANLIIVEIFGVTAI